MSGCSSGIWIWQNLFMGMRFHRIGARTKIWQDVCMNYAMDVIYVAACCAGQLDNHIIITSHNDYLMMFNLMPLSFSYPLLAQLPKWVAA
jgi:hypothetical protein